MEKVLEERNEEHINKKFPISIYEVHVDSKNDMLPHYHDNFEILYIKKGKLNVKIGANSYVVKEKSILFVNMYQVHSAFAIDNTSAEFYAIVFNKKILESINLNDYYIKYMKPFIDGQSRFPESIEFGTDLYLQVEESILLIIKEYYSKDIAYEIYIETAIERLFASLVRYKKILDDSLNEKISSINQKYIKDILNYIENHYQENISLQDLAYHLNIDKYYLCRLIKKITGKSFTKILNIFRIKQAIIYLKSTTKPIYEIAQLTGYNNLSYFNRKFLKYAGCTPSKIRK